MPRFQRASSAFKTFVVLAVLALIVLAGWVLYQRIQSGKVIDTYRDCVLDGNPVQESYPSRCVTKDGRSFDNPSNKVFQPPGDNNINTD